jgi:hypothetical protein
MGGYEGKHVGVFVSSFVGRWGMYVGSWIGG